MIGWIVLAVFILGISIMIYDWYKMINYINKQIKANGVILFIANISLTVILATFYTIIKRHIANNRGKINMKIVAEMIIFALLIILGIVINRDSIEIPDSDRLLRGYVRLSKY